MNVEKSDAVSTTQRTFVGGAWINKCKVNGKETHNIKISLSTKGKNALKTLTINALTDVIELWPNDKRDGKKDADYSVSVVSK